MDYCPPGFYVHGILQARILEWVAMSCSRGSSCPRDQTHISCDFSSFIKCKPRREGYILPGSSFWAFFFSPSDGGGIKRERAWSLLFFRLNVKFAQEIWANILESLSPRINCFTGWLYREYHIYRNEMIPLWRVFHHRISWPGHLTPNLQR